MTQRAARAARIDNAIAERMASEIAARDVPLRAAVGRCIRCGGSLRGDLYSLGDCFLQAIQPFASRWH